MLDCEQNAAILKNLEEFDTLVEKIGDKICCLYVYSTGKLDKEIFNYLPSNIKIIVITEGK